MYKILLGLLISIMLLSWCGDKNKEETWQIDNNIDNEIQAWDSEGYISSGDQWVFIQEENHVIEWKSTEESDDEAQVSPENPLNF